jgi:carbonic anhydrase/acetyltransferase-like protein (isoleucine patch superfamily)
MTMISANPNGDMPQIDTGAYVDPTARIIGNVHIAAGCYVGPYAVIRADESSPDGSVAPICIGENTNVQDAVIIHALAGTQVTIGRRCSIAHGAIIHGPCTIGDGCFVGFKAVVYSSTLAGEVFVGTSAVVQSVELSRGSLVAPAAAILSKYDVVESVGEITSAEQTFMNNVVEVNLKLVKGYKAL